MAGSGLATGFKASWWVHLPGMAAVVAMIVVMAAQRPWPARAPTHFDFHWNIDRWGSPATTAVFPFLAAMILLAGLIASAAWARHEEGRKRFNLTLLLIAAPLGAIVGLHFWYWLNISRLAATGHADHGWSWVVASAAIMLALTNLLERIRKPLAS